MAETSAQAAPDRGDEAPLRSLPMLRSLLVANFASGVGSTAVVLGIAVLSYGDSGSVLHTVAVSAAYSLPMALLGMTAGRLVGRTSHRTVLLVCDLVKPALYVVMGVLALAGLLHVPELLVFAALTGSVSAFAVPAWMALERDLVPASRLDEANALFGSASSAASVVGALVGGTLISVVGAWSVFFLDALSFGPLLWVLARADPAASQPRPHPPVHVGAVLRYVRSERLLRISFARTAFLALLVAPVSQLFPAIADALGDTSDLLGWVTAAFATGAILLAWVIGRLKRRFSRIAIVNISALVTSVTVFAFGLLGEPLTSDRLAFLVIALLVPLGLLFSLAQSILSAIVQVRVDPEMEGGVFATYAVVYTVLAPVGGVALGLYADTHDVWDALALSGAVLFVVSLAFLPSWRTSVRSGDIDAQPPAPGDHRRPRAHRHGHLDGLLRGHLGHPSPRPRGPGPDEPLR